MKRFFSALLLLLSLSLAIFFVSCGDETKPDTNGGGSQTATCEHQWNRGKTEKEATCTEPGTVLKTCLICEETKIEETPALGHDFSESWNENSQQHWHDCKRSGCSVKDSVGLHDFQKDETLSYAETCGADGLEVKACICGQKQENVIPATGKHTMSEEFSFDDTDHYHVCSVCKGKADAVPHTWVEGDVVGGGENSCQSATRKDTCACGAERVVVLPAAKPHTGLRAEVNVKDMTVTYTCTECNTAKVFTYQHYYTMDDDVILPLRDNGNSIYGTSGTKFINEIVEDGDRVVQKIWYDGDEKPSNGQFQTGNDVLTADHLSPEDAMLDIDIKSVSAAKDSSANLQLMLYAMGGSWRNTPNDQTIALFRLEKGVIYAVNGFDESTMKYTEAAIGEYSDTEYTNIKVRFSFTTVTEKDDDGNNVSVKKLTFTVYINGTYAHSVTVPSYLYNHMYTKMYFNGNIWSKGDGFYFDNVMVCNY